MKVNKSILIAGGIAAALYIANKAKGAVNAANQLFFEVFSVKYLGGGIFQSQLEVKLTVHNPTQTALSFDSFQGTLSINGVRIADAYYEPGSGINIPANSTTYIPVPVSIIHQDVITKLPNIISDIKNANITVNGSVTVAGISIPISKTVGISGINQSRAKDPLVYG